MGLIHGGWLVARMLKREGVEVVFTLSGGHIMMAVYARVFALSIHVTNKLQFTRQRAGLKQRVSQE